MLCLHGWGLKESGLPWTLFYLSSLQGAELLYPLVWGQARFQNIKLKTSSFELRDTSIQKLSRGRKREWTKNKRKRWERRKGLSWHQSWLCAVWFEYFESRISSIWITSVKNNTVGVHVEYKDTQKLEHFSFGCRNPRAIVKSWFCYDLECSSIHFTLSWQQKTSHVGKVPISESLHWKSWTGNSNLISRQFSYTDNKATADDWSWNLKKLQLVAFVFNSIVVIYKLPATKLNILRLLLQSILSLGWLYSLPVVLQEVVSSGRLADKCPADAKAMILYLLGLFLSFSKELSTCFASQCFI